MTKMTYVSALSTVLSTCELSAEVREKLEALKAQCEKKNAVKSGKPTAKQTANEGIKAAILECLSDGMARSVTDVIKECPACAELTNQKVSALMKQMVDSGDVVRAEVKGKAMFSIAPVDAE